MVAVLDPELKVRRVESRRDRERFLKLPWSLYATNPAWVPPLLALQRDRLSPRANPYFRHADVALFLAERSGRVVGRISAQVCQLVQQHHGHGIGHFGMCACADNAVTAEALFDAASDWLRTRGMTRVMGPFDLSINDETGMLVEGFDDPPYVMMGHHHSYYSALLEDVGFVKEMDVFAYRGDVSKPYDLRLDRLVQRATGDGRIKLRQISRKNRSQELRRVLEVFKDGWSENWGYVPPTEAEVDRLVRHLRRLLDRGIVTIADVDGEDAGFMVVLPNLNEVITDLNGRLFPFGWLKLLWRLRFAQFDSLRIPLMGIRKQHQGTRVGASVAISMIDSCRKTLLRQGAQRCEM